MRFEFLFQFTSGQGWKISRETWRNQYGCGVIFGLRAGFFRFEASIDLITKL